MRKLLVMLLLAASSAWMAPAANATAFNWNLGELGDLDHHTAWRWGLGTSDSQGTSLYNQLNSGNYTITGATLTFRNIWDWQPETDALFLNLLTNTTAGLTSFADNTNDTELVNYFAGQGTYLGYWTDLNGGSVHNVDVVYNFATTTHPGFVDAPSTNLLTLLTNYILTSNANSYLGLTFDPDCHYWNDGISFSITTTQKPQDPGNPVVPEPATLTLLGLGISGLGMLRRRRMA